MNNFAKIQVSNLNLILLPSTGEAIGRYWAEVSKNYIIAFYRHINYIPMQNLESLTLMVFETDMAKLIFIVTLIKNIYMYFMGSHMSPSTCYIHSS